MRPLWHALNAAILLFLPLPLLIVAAVSISPARFISFPPTGFSLIWYRQFLSSPEWTHALATSAAIATAVALLTTIAAIMTALALERAGRRGRGVVETLILAPLIFPHAAIGVALFGLLSSIAALRGTYAGIALAHLILCVPFAFRPIATAFARLDPALAKAAISLGAHPIYTFRRVTLPLLAPGIVSALLFTFIVSFDEITVTLFLTAPGITTLPLTIYARLEQSADPVVAAVSTLLVLLTLGLVLLLQRTIGLELFVNLEAES